MFYCSGLMTNIFDFFGNDIANACFFNAIDMLYYDKKLTLTLTV